MTVIQFELEDFEVQQLREVVDALPLNPYIRLVNKILPALPMTDVDVTSPMSAALANSLRNRAVNVPILEKIAELTDPTPYCIPCGARTRARCHCGDIADCE